MNSSNTEDPGPNPNQNPDITQKLLQCKTDTERIAQLDRQLVALQEEREEKTRQARQAFLDANTARYADVDPVRALTGAAVKHTLTVAKAAAYRIRPPVGATTHAVNQFCVEAGKLGPVSAEESVLLSWLVEVQLLGKDDVEAQPAQDLTKLPIDQRLTLLRQLPVTLQNKLADECIGMQTWLSIYLDVNLGN